MYKAETYTVRDSKIGLCCVGFALPLCPPPSPNLFIGLLRRRLCLTQMQAASLPIPDFWIALGIYYKTPPKE